MNSFLRFIWEANYHLVLNVSFPTAHTWNIFSRTSTCMKKLEALGCHTQMTTLKDGSRKDMNGAKAKTVRRSGRCVKKFKSRFKTDKDPWEPAYFSGLGFRKQTDINLNNLQG